MINIKVDKYNLSSPEIKDTSLIDFVFLDQQRYQLPEGDYTLSLNITDNNKNNEEIKHEQAISIKSINNGFSDVQLLESYSQTIEKNILSKGGYDLVPFISNTHNTSLKIGTLYGVLSESFPSAALVSQSTQKIVNKACQKKKM